MVEEKKRCPFCGEDEPEILPTIKGTTQGSRTITAYVYCENCGARGPVSYSQESLEDAEGLAIFDWNDRHTEQQTDGA